MTRYRGNVEAVRNLVRETEVHRDVYIDDEVFALEMEHLFANTWIYVGHDSQVAKPGDYFGTTIGTQPILMVRHTDDSVKVLHNRCPHKGTRITTDTCGNTGKFFRCPYHAWTFRTDGSLFFIPLRKGYENTGLETSHASAGISPVRHVRHDRGFVFAKLNDADPDFEEFFGESLSSIDNMVDRSPAGRLEVTGGMLRYMHNCNWKMVVENQTDTTHPMVAHESSAGTAIEVWKKLEDLIVDVDVAMNLRLANQIPDSLDISAVPRHRHLLGISKRSGTSSRPISRGTCAPKTFSLQPLGMGQELFQDLDRRLDVVGDAAYAEAREPPQFHGHLRHLDDDRNAIDDRGPIDGMAANGREQQHRNPSARDQHVYPGGHERPRLFGK